MSPTLDQNQLNTNQTDANFSVGTFDRCQTFSFLGN